MAEFLILEHDGVSGACQAVPMFLHFKDDSAESAQNFGAFVKGHLINVVDQTPSLLWNTAVIGGWINGQSQIIYSEHTEKHRLDDAGIIVHSINSTRSVVSRNGELYAG